MTGGAHPARDGATYNAYDDERSDRPGCRSVPVIDSESGTGSRAGLLERAELFNLVLRDIYGDRELIRRGSCRPR
jgi:uncharacterized circularly permuted ATP-grasp superfamily protein